MERGSFGRKKVDLCKSWGEKRFSGRGDALSPTQGSRGLKFWNRGGCGDKENLDCVECEKKEKACRGERGKRPFQMG